MVTRKEHEELKKRIDRMYGINKRIESFYIRLEKVEIALSMLEKDNTMFRNILRSKSLSKDKRIPKRFSFMKKVKQ
jgi:hypothetical protein